MANPNERLRDDLTLARSEANLRGAKLAALVKEYAALKREVERLDSAYKWLSQTNTRLVEMRETAEAGRAEGEGEKPIEE